MRHRRRTSSTFAAIAARVLLICVVLLSPAGLVHGVSPAEDLLPDSTCLFVSFPDMEALRTSFDQTQIGQLAQDPVMKPFADDLRDQLQNRFGRTDLELGVKWEDLKGVYSGEACIARVQPGNKATEHATILLLDVTNKAKQVTEVRQTIAANMSKRKATPSEFDIDKVRVTSYKLRKKRGDVKERYVFIAEHADQLFVANHQRVIEGVIRNAQKAGDKKTGSLASFKIFADVMTELGKESNGLEPHIRWFVRPFKYADVVRASQRGRGTGSKKTANILVAQGFDAIRAVGGHVNMKVSGYEVLHRTFVFAPPVTDLPTKFNAAARMLVFPAVDHTPLPGWIPRNAATFLSASWKIKEGFDFSTSLIDAFVSKDFVQDVLTSLKNETKVDIRGELFANLDGRIITFSDFEMPITTKSERLLVAVRIKDGEEETVQLALNKLGEFEPQAKPRKFGELDGWEIVPEESLEDEDLAGIDLSGAGSIPIPGSVPVPGSDDEGTEDLSLPNAALVVARGPNKDDPAFLFIASHVDLLERILAERPPHETLGASEDFKAVNQMLSELGAGEDSFRFFSRTDDEYRMAYEMIRKGEMPQSESLLGKLLDRLLGPEDDSPRKSEIDGSKLPNYQVIRRYLGPASLFVKPHPNGWMTTGIMVSKEQLLDKNAQAQAKLTTASAK